MLLEDFPGTAGRRLRLVSRHRLSTMSLMGSRRQNVSQKPVTDQMVMRGADTLPDPSEVAPHAEKPASGLRRAS
jgi:hypothetical protein